MVTFKNFRTLLKEADSNNGVINGDVDLSKSYLKEIPSFLKDVIVNGNLTLRRNQLTSLKNIPRRITGNLSCGDNNIKSLEELTDVELSSGYTTTPYFNCCNNDLESLIGLPKNYKGTISATSNMLKNLQGCPRYIDGGLYVGVNNLITLEGGPVEVTDSFWCYQNKLTTLLGAPQRVGGGFDCVDNPLKNIDGFPRAVDGDVTITKIPQVVEIGADIFNSHLYTIGGRVFVEG